MRTLSIVSATPLLLALFAASARADLTFAKVTVDVGEVRSGAPLKRVFAFVNDGPGPVEITDLHTTCGCIKPRLDKRAYQPGERGEVVLEVQTLSQPAGEHSWELHVAYQTGGAGREAELTLKGRVITEITLQPAAMTISTEGATAHEMILTDVRARPLAVTGVQSSLPSLTGGVKETARDAAGHRVITMWLGIAADCAPGRHDATVAILTDDADYRVLTVPVTIVKRSKPKVTAAPPAVMLSAVAGQPVASRIVLLRPAGDEAVAIEKIDCDDHAIVCTWAAGPGQCATVKVTIDRTKLPPAGLRSAIHVHINKSASDTITVPVTVSRQ